MKELVHEKISCNYLLKEKQYHVEKLVMVDFELILSVTGSLLTSLHATFSFSFFFVFTSMVYHVLCCRIFFPYHVDEVLRNAIQRCLVREPKKRPTIQELLDILSGKQSEEIKLEL